MVSQKEMDGQIQGALRDLNDGRTAIALRSLRRLVELDPDNLEIHYLLGIALLREGEFRAGVPHLEKVVASEFGYLHKQQALMLLGYAAAVRELLPEAEAAFRRALEYNFNNDAACSALAHVHFRMGEYGKALEYSRRALDANPASAGARNSLAYVLCESGGDLEEALRAAILASKAEPANPAYQDTLGWIYHKKGRGLLARETLKRALELAPESEEIKAHLRIVLGMD